MSATAAKSAPQKEVSAEAVDPVIEMLQRYGFKYKPETLQISSINRKQSELNQARIAKPINDEQVVMYAEQMENGDKFPRIVVYKVSSGYIVMDGNHRVAASDLAGFTTIAAYIVDSPAPAEVQAFTYEANTKHGLPTSLDDRLSQAIYLTEQKVSAPDAAKSLGVPLNTLRHALDNYNAEKRFAGLGVKKFSGLTATHKRKLDSIHSDVALKAVAELTLDAGLSSDELGRIVRDVNGIRNERDQLKAIAAVRESRAATIKATASGRIPIPTVISTYTRATSTINRLNEGNLEKAILNLPAEVREELAVASADAMTRLMEVVRVVKRAAQG